MCGCVRVCVCVHVCLTHRLKITVFETRCWQQIETFIFRYKCPFDLNQHTHTHTHNCPNMQFLCANVVTSKRKVNTDVITCDKMIRRCSWCVRVCVRVRVCVSKYIYFLALKNKLSLSRTDNVPTVSHILNCEIL
jgi:hypothetical protein